MGCQEAACLHGAGSRGRPCQVLLPLGTSMASEMTLEVECEGASAPGGDQVERGCREE